MKDAGLLGLFLPIGNTKQTATINNNGDRGTSKFNSKEFDLDGMPKDPM